MSTPSNTTTTGSDSLDDLGALEAPIWVKIGGGTVALMGIFAIMLGAQIALSVSRPDTTIKAMMGLYFLGGVGAVASSVGVMRAKTSGAVQGLILSVVLGIAVLVPIFWGIFSLASFAGAGLALLGTILMALSIPACRVVTKNRQRLTEI